MTIARWTPPVAPTRQEQFLLKRLDRVRKLLGFLRLHRHELFDDAFQDELAAMYRTTGAGKEARPPAMMAMATLVQGYLGISDAEMIELTVVDLRVQMVLGCLGAEAPAVFARRVAGVSRTADRRRPGSARARTHRRRWRRRTKAFDPRKLPKTLRVAIDSSPLEGAGRVEDTFNLLAHAARNVVSCAAGLLGWTDEQVCRQAGIPLLAGRRASSARSTSTGTMRSRRREAITTFSRQLDALQSWIARQLPEELAQAAAQGAGRDPRADPDAGSGARSAGRWVAHSRGRGGGSTGLDRGPGDASRPQEQEQAVQRIQAAHCRGRRSRPDPRLRHHAGESSRGRSDAVLDGRHGAPGTRRRPPADRPRVHQQHARR